MRPLSRFPPSPYDLYCVGGTLSLTQSILNHVSVSHLLYLSLRCPITNEIPPERSRGVRVVVRITVGLVSRANEILFWRFVLSRMIIRAFRPSGGRPPNDCTCRCILRCRIFHFIVQFHSTAKNLWWWWWGYRIGASRKTARRPGNDVNFFRAVWCNWFRCILSFVTLERT